MLYQLSYCRLIIRSTSSLTIGSLGSAAIRLRFRQVLEVEIVGGDGHRFVEVVIAA